MGPRPPFPTCVLPKVKIMRDGRSVDVNSGNSSPQASYGKGQITFY